MAEKAGLMGPRLGREEPSIWPPPLDDEDFDDEPWEVS